MTLSETWFMEGFIDFELQKYRLLSYLQDVRKCFDATKLYPQLSDMIFHYNNLVAFRDNKRLLQNQFPKQMDKVNMEQLEIVYKQMLADDEVMQELEHITEYALHQMKGAINNGTEIYEYVERQLHIEPVGIVPLYKNEGYMLLQYGLQTEIRAYAYTVTLFEHRDAKYKGIKVSYCDSWPKNISNTYEYIKRDLIRSHPALPNPAVYSVDFPLQVPLNETLLPIAKRMLVRTLIAQ